MQNLVCWMFIGFETSRVGDKFQNFIVIFYWMVVEILFLACFER